MSAPDQGSPAVEKEKSKKGAGDFSSLEEYCKAENVKFLSDPLELANLQSFPRETPFQFLNGLPKSVQRRIRALKKLQLDCTYLEADFYKKVHELECEFAQKFKPLSDKRSSIVAGGYEPTDPECDYPLVSDADLAAEVEEKVTNVTLEDKEESQEKVTNAQDAWKKDENVKGIPEFWLTVFRNVDILADLIQADDEPILMHLTDIEVQMNEMGFTLNFSFSPNEWFTNPVLSKEYSMRCEPDKDEPFEFDGPEIISCKGCAIDWKPNKNVTLKLIKKKQKHRQRGATRFVTKQVKADSLFNFFDPPAVPETPELEAEMDDETKELLNADFEIGQMLRDRVIPRAVLYYTDEAREDDSFDEDEEDTCDLESGSESEVDSGDEAVVNAGDQNGVAKPGEKPQECKQQ